MLHSANSEGRDLRAKEQVHSDLQVPNPPQGHFIPCLLPELLCSVGCPEAQMCQGHAGHHWLQRSGLVPQGLRGGGSLSLVGTVTAAGGCWQPGDKLRSRGIRKSLSCSAVAQSQPSPLLRD